MKIRIAEIFESVSGEVGGFPQGSPTTFVRLAGCSLGCPFCDTRQWQDQESGTERTIEDVMKEIFSFPWKQVLITGGEPMEQKEAVQALVDKIKRNSIGYRIQVETNGTIPLSDMYLVDYWVVDNKGMDAMAGVTYQFDPHMIGGNMWIKCLVGSLADLDSAIGFAAGLQGLAERVRPKVAISVISGKPWSSKRTNIQEAVKAILTSKIPILLNTQIHKVFGVR